jgi:DNA-binding transcriptional MerR regulator
MLEPQRRGGRRYYQQADIEVILKIKHLVDVHGYTLSKARSVMIGSTYKPTSPIGKRLKAEEKSKMSRKGMADLDTSPGFTHIQLAEICRVDERTARRYISEKKAPYSVCRLMDLIFKKRVLPDSWSYCFINHRDNIEINGVGEVSENDILNIRWTRQLYESHKRTLEIKLDRAKEKIRSLEKHLEEARGELGELPAANEPWGEDL